jgi:hypothetical protein
MAIGYDGPTAATVQSGAFNQVRFIAFLEALRVRLVARDPHHQWLAIMDNVRFHKTASVAAWGESHSANIRLQYLPAYSPFLDPVEECFGFVKETLKSRMRECLVTEWTDASLLANLVTILNHGIPAEHCDAWCRHAEAFFPRCLAEEPIYVE